LLLAGLYQQALQDRRDGRASDAALLIEEAARRFPGDVEVQLLAAESLVVDRNDPEAGLAVLEALPATQDRRLRAREEILRADTLQAAGRHDEAIAVLEALVREFPTSERLAQRLEKLKARSSAPRP